VQVAVHVGQLLQPVPGGIGRYVSRLVEALPGAGVEVVAFAAGPPPSGVDGPYVDLGWPRGALRYEAWARLRRPALDVPAGVVHATSLAVPPPGRRPLVVTVHDLVFLRHPEHLTPRGVSFHRRGLELARREAAAIVVLTAFGRDELVAEGFEEGRIHVAHHGIAVPVPSAAADPESDQAVLRRLGVHPPFVLFVGTLEPRKGISDLVAAHRLLRRSHPDLGLILAGPPGWGTPPDLGGPGVVALGSAHDDDLDALYRAAVALVLPSRYEGFGLPVLEAMAQGCPVVVSDAGALVEVAGGAATVVAGGDVDALAGALDHLASDPDHRHRLSAAGRSRAADFSWSNSAEAHARTYRAVVQTSGGSSA
jgi:glycosyltransferase involved in cell wall biosynthesis